MRNALLVAATALTVVVTACTGGSSSPKSPTPGITTATVAPAPTAVPSPVPVPPKPAAFADYGRAIATYLSASPAAAANCLADLYAAWQMNLTRGCRNANTDGDTESELVAVIAQTPPVGDTQFAVLILDSSAGGYRIAYESPALGLAPEAAIAGGGPVLDIVDVNGGAPDLIYRSDACATGVCTTTIHVISGSSGGEYIEQPPVGAIKIEAVDSATVDASGRIVLTGVSGETPATGPQRGRSETWAWKDGAFAVIDRKPAPPRYLYHAILDADALMALGDYAGAQAAFTAAVEDKRLKVWRPDSRERPELESYGLFHAGVAVLLGGGDAAVARQYFDRSRAYTTTLHAQLAGSFQAAYDAKHSVSIACGADLDDVHANLAEYQNFWDFGTANPRFDSTTVCPY